MSSANSTLTSSQASALYKVIWSASLPLEIRLSPADCRIYDQADPYLIHFPRLAYLPFLLPRLHAFFASFLIDPGVPASDGWFEFEGVPLKWHYPLGLLYDLFSGAEPTVRERGPSATLTSSALAQAGPSLAFGGDNVEDTEEKEPLPWKLIVHFTTWPDDQLVRLDGEGRVMHDAFINSVKEADFLRFGNAKGIMTMSKEDSTQLWTAVQNHDHGIYTPINHKLLNPPGSMLRHVPLKIYLPSSSPSPATSTPASPPPPEQPSSSSSSPTPPPAPSSDSQGPSLRVVQALIPPMVSTREPQTLGTALHALLPDLFPSRRTPVLARAVLHGAVIPLAAPVVDLMRTAAYLDGWIGVGVRMLG